MPSSHHKRYGLAAGLLAAASLAGVGWLRANAQNVPPATPPSAEVQETGITMPLKEWTPVFKYQGVIRDVPVKEGEAVKAGDLLLAQDDQEERIELLADQKLADSKAGVKSAEAALIGRKADLISKQAEHEAKKKEYERVKKILDEGGRNDFEVDKAKYEMDAASAAIDAANGMIASAEADIDKATAEQDQAKYKADHQEAHLKLMKIVAQEDGVVLNVNVQPGDAADPNRQTPLITVVKIDKLKVEFHLPATEAQKLKIGQQLRVKYNHEDWQQATVMPLPPVALAPAGGLQTVHMELPNPKLRAAGQSIYIELPPDIVAQRNQETAAALK